MVIGRCEGIDDSERGTGRARVDEERELRAVMPAAESTLTTTWLTGFSRRQWCETG